MKFNLFNKFIIAFISVGLLPVLFISSYSAFLFQKETRSMLEDNYRATAFYAARNIDSLVEKYNTISKLLYSYSAAASGIVRRTDGLGIAEILKTETDNESSRIKRHNDIINFLHLINSSDRHIANVIFVENNPEFTIYTFGYNNRPLVDREKFLAMTGYRQEPAVYGIYGRGSVTERINRLYVIPTHQDDYFQKRPDSVFTIGRNYIDLSFPLGFEPVLGTLYIDVDIRAIDDIFNRLGLYRHNGIRIMDSGGNVIYSNGVIIKNPFELTELCSPCDWRVIINVDLEQAAGNIINLVWLIYIIVIIILFILLALSVVYSNVFSSPIRAMLRGMKQVEEGDFDIKLNVRGQDEIKLLADGFMEMTAKLQNYIQTSLLSKLRLREAELGSLRARIKPHFLYNSLEIIRMNAIAHDDESTAELAFLLAEFMHALIEGGRNEVPLKDELKLLQSYLAFIDIRYEGRIVWKISAGKELSNAKVLSLMIQPVVENAIIHGIEPHGDGRIDIKISREGDNLVIVITDDGAGMDDETKAKLDAQLDLVSGDTETVTGTDSAGAGDSIGLKNVHDRLRYSYGSPYGISIESRPGRTAITMLLPWQEARDD